MRKLTSRDLLSLQLIESPQISPDGKEIMFVHKTFDAEKNDYRQTLCVIPADGVASSPEEFSPGPSDSEPQFSPDGRAILFLRKVGEYKQLFVKARHGGQARQITHFKHSVASPAWSPDGGKIVFSAIVPLGGPVSEGEKPPEDPYKKYNEDVKLIRRIWYKLDGTGFIHDKRSQIFTVDVESESILQLTQGEHDAETPQFFPDGTRIVFSSNRNPDSDHEFMSFIYVVPVGGGAPVCLTVGNYYFRNPSVSADGKWIAFVGNDEPENWYANLGLWVIASGGGTPVCLTPKARFCVGNQSIDDLRGLTHGEAPRWSRDGGMLYVSVSEAGKTFLLGVDLHNRTFTPFADGRHVVAGWHLAAASDQAVLAVTDPQTPNDLWILDVKTGKIKRLTELNAPFLSDVRVIEPESFTATSSDGTQVEAWMLKPADFAEGKKYPCLIEIHGGPMAMYGYGFFFEFQLLASRGYVVVYANPRGSFGYGQPYCEAIQGDWGNRDYQDVMAVLEESLKKGCIDPARLGVLGGSYGGFMTNWIIGHTDRFKAAVTMRSVTNEHSMFGTSDYGFLGDQNLGCLPWEKPEAYLKMSPISYVDKMKTPLLILHAEQDHRCPVEQAEQLFVALKKLKREVVFIRFPEESHDLSRIGKPWHRIFRLDQIVDWFAAHL